MNSGVSNEDWEKFVAYVGGFYGNMSNYHSFGDMKFIPDLTPETFKKIGLVGGVLGLISIGILNGYTMMLQIYAKLKLNQTVVSYSDLGEKVLGIHGRRIIKATMSKKKIIIGLAVFALLCFSIWFFFVRKKGPEYKEAKIEKKLKSIII